MPWPLAYHADDQIRAWTVGVAIVVGAILVIGGARAFRRESAKEAKNVAARVSFALGALSLVLIPAPGFVLFGGWLLPVGGVVLGYRGLRRTPVYGERTLALAGFALAGLGFSFVTGWVVACIATDACFH